MKNTQKGFIVPLLIAIVAVLAIGGGVYLYTQNKPAVTSSPTSVVDTGSIPSTQNTNTNTPTGTTASVIDCGSSSLLDSKGNFATETSLESDSVLSCFGKYLSTCQPAKVSLKIKDGTKQIYQILPSNGQCAISMNDDKGDSISCPSVQAILKDSYENSINPKYSLTDIPKHFGAYAVNVLFSTPLYANTFTSCSVSPNSTFQRHPAYTATTEPTLTITGPVSASQAGSFTLTWTSKNIPSSASVNIYITPSNNIRRFITTTPNTGSKVINLATYKDLASLSGSRVIEVQATIDGVIYSGKSTIQIKQLSSSVTDGSFTATPASGSAPLKLTFHMSGKDSMFATFKFGDGTMFSVGAPPTGSNFNDFTCNAAGPSSVCQGTHTYSAPGTYSATLYDAQGTQLDATTIVVTNSSSASLTSSQIFQAASSQLGFTSGQLSYFRIFGQDKIQYSFGSGTNFAYKTGGVWYLAGKGNRQDVGTCSEYATVPAQYNPGCYDTTTGQTNYMINGQSVNYPPSQMVSYIGQ